MAKLLSRYQSKTLRIQAWTYEVRIAKWVSGNRQRLVLVDDKFTNWKSFIWMGYFKWQCSDLCNFAYNNDSE